MSVSNILLLQGHGNNESEMARILSAHARVVLIQKGWMHRVSVWELGHERIVQDEGPVSGWRLDDALFNPISSGWLYYTAMMLAYGKTMDDEFPINYDVCIAMNYDAFHAAELLRKTGKVKKLILTISDYLPPATGLVGAHRKIAQKFTDRAAMSADRVWCVTNRIPCPVDYDVMPIPITPCEPSERIVRSIAYIGYPRVEHNLETLVKLSDEMHYGVDIIGDSPYLKSLQIPRDDPAVMQCGQITNYQSIHPLVHESACGFAVYDTVGNDNPLKYGINGKIWTYLSHGLPVIVSYDSPVVAMMGYRGPICIVHPNEDGIREGIEYVFANAHELRARVKPFVTQWNKRVEDFYNREVLEHETI